MLRQINYNRIYAIFDRIGLTFQVFAQGLVYFVSLVEIIIIIIIIVIITFLVYKEPRSTQWHSEIKILCQGIYPFHPFSDYNFSCQFSDLQFFHRLQFFSPIFTIRILSPSFSIFYMGSSTEIAIIKWYTLLSSTE